jgi:hypothetical protein
MSHITIIDLITLIMCPRILFITWMQFWFVSVGSGWGGSMKGGGFHGYLSNS